MKLLRFLSMIVICAVLANGFPAFAANADLGDYDDFLAGESSSMINLTSNMRAVIIEPEKDFILSETETEAEVSFRLDAIYSNIKDIGLNTVILGVTGKERTYYNPDMNSVSSGDDYISVAVEKARDYELNVFLIYDINRSADASENQADAINGFISDIHRFTLKYNCDGIILNDYYAKQTTESFRKYMESGSGIGYTNWLYDKTEYFIETASSVIRLTNNSIPVGIMINDMWANDSSNAEGSPTNDSFEAYYDGFSDTKKFIEKGYADFVMLRSYGSIEDRSLPFVETAEWWGKLCSEQDINLYLIHYNEKVGSPTYGWAEDQILQQLITAKKSVSSYSGSVFNSYGALEENRLNSAGTLQMYYKDEINEESVFEDLQMHSPKSLSFTTTEPVAVFAGSFDENFDVYLNGAKIKLNEAGNFYFEKELEVGVNKFTLQHKSKTYTYKIEKKIVTLREIDSSIENGKKLKVEGGTKIKLQAVAYKGSVVTAAINGQTITLKESSATLNDDDRNTSYASFTGSYTAPEGIVETEQNLGTINISASYKGGYLMTAVGASVTVRAKPKPVVTNISYDMYDDSTVGTNEVVGTIDMTHPAGDWYKYVKINKNYTQIYDAKTTGSDIDPDFGQLPAGTIDYLDDTVGGYYTTDSGKRFKASDVTIVEDYGIGENNLSIKTLGTSDGKSFIELGLGTKTSFNVETVGNNYFTGWGTDFNVSEFNAKYVYITFDNITSVTKLPSFDTSLVFSSGTWEQVVIDGIPKFRLVLTLRQQGVYAGCGAYYNNSNNLMLTFPVMQNNLSGLTIVIDPGHGYGQSADKFDPGAIGHVVEQEVNLAIAKELTAQLTALGANAVRLKTEEKLYLTYERAATARSYNCDIFISLHSNSVLNNDTVKGTEVYYFTPFSQPLAASISKGISAYFASSVYEDGANKDRGAKFQLFWVTLQQDFPSVLVELGFVTNLEDAMALANTEHQKGIAKGIVSGISNYISRSNINRSGDYSGAAAVPDTAQTAADTTEDTDIENTDESAEDAEDFAEEAESSAVEAESPAEEAESSAEESGDDAEMLDDEDDELSEIEDE